LFTVGELSADQQGLVKLARDRTPVAVTIEQVNKEQHASIAAEINNTKTRLLA
jgi:hypothetical protein